MWIRIGAKKRRRKRKRNELRFGENETLKILDGPGKFSPPPSLPPHAGWSTRRRFADAREEMD